MLGCKVIRRAGYHSAEFSQSFRILCGLSAGKVQPLRHGVSPRCASCSPANITPPDWSSGMRPSPVTLRRRISPGLPMRPHNPLPLLWDAYSSGALPGWDTRRHCVATSFPQNIFESTVSRPMSGLSGKFTQKRLKQFLLRPFSGFDRILKTGIAAQIPAFAFEAD